MAINLSLSKMPWYAQLGAFAMLSAAGAGVFWNFYAKPAQASIDQREAQLATLQTEIQRGVGTARRLPEFRRQVQDLEAQLERLRPVLPSEKDVAELLRRIQGMATRQMYAEWPIGLQIEGTYHNLGTFLERVSKFPRIINVTGIHIKGADPKDAGTSAHSIRAECTATTFVLIEPKKAAAPVATTGKGP
jgi:type IV pilus assembly protein PilO